MTTSVKCPVCHKTLGKKDRTLALHMFREHRGASVPRPRRRHSGKPTPKRKRRVPS